jgi:glycosyltransferase involved in cell wall biosynthesis
VSELAADLVPWADIRIVGNPIAEDVIPREKSSSDNFRVAYLAGSDRFYKGFDLIPEIVEGSSSPAVRWILYTSPPYSAKDEACHRAWDRLLEEFSDRVEIRARTNNVSSAFANADLVLAPSRQESFNRVIAESLRTGTPFVASDIAPHRSHAAASGAGLLLNHPAEAGGLIDDLVTNRVRYAALQANAKANAQMFSVDRIVQLVEEAWLEASGSGPT